MPELRQTYTDQHHHPCLPTVVYERMPVPDIYSTILHADCDVCMSTYLRLNAQLARALNAQLRQTCTDQHLNPYNPACHAHTHADVRLMRERRRHLELRAAADQFAPARDRGWG